MIVLFHTRIVPFLTAFQTIDILGRREHFPIDNFRFWIFRRILLFWSKEVTLHQNLIIIIRTFWENLNLVFLIMAGIINKIHVRKLYKLSFQLFVTLPGESGRHIDPVSFFFIPLSVHTSQTSSRLYICYPFHVPIHCNLSYQTHDAVIIYPITLLYIILWIFLSQSLALLIFAFKCFYYITDLTRIHPII